MDIPGTNLEEIAQYLTQDFLKRLRSQILKKVLSSLGTPLILYLRQPMSDWKFSSAPNIFGKFGKMMFIFTIMILIILIVWPLLVISLDITIQREKGEISYWIRLNTDRVVYLHKSPTFGVQAEIKEISNS